MGFLHKLWDETLAGPTPDDGLGKLRKYNSFSATRSPSLTNHPLLDHEISTTTTTPISRSITILRANSTNLPNLNANASPGSSSLPSSPSGSITPGSPYSPSTPRAKKLTRRKSTAAAIQCEESRSPTGYDWIVLSALDR